MKKAPNPTPAHQTLPANHIGRDFYLGDLHGCLDLLRTAMGRTDFDPERDRVIAVGDLIDRGEHSIECLSLIDEPWFFSAMGNHEAMMLDALDTPDKRMYWHINGGTWATNLAENKLQFLGEKIRPLPLALTVEQPDGPPIGITHADYGPADWAELDAALEDTHKRMHMLWGRTTLSKGRGKRVAGVRATIHGHTPVDRVTCLGNMMFIDTGAVYGGTLSFATFNDLLTLG